MAHIIKHLTIKNLKSCKNLEIDLSSFTPIVGYNNAGKSNILSSINWLLKPKIIPQSGYNNPQQDIVVEALFTGVSEKVIALLKPEHQDPIRPYIDAFGQIYIRRTQPPGAMKSTEIKFEIKDPDTGNFKSNPRGIFNAIKALFPDPIEIGAMENAADDSANAKTTTTIGKLLKEISSQMNANNVKVASRYLSALTRRLDSEGDRRNIDFQNLDDSISDKVESFFPGIQLKLHFEVPTFEDLIQSGTVRIYENGPVGRNVGEYGHGTQRAVQMALIQQLSETKKGIDSPTTTLLLIDEPELYLHPFAIEQIKDALQVLSTCGYQIVFTTHSAQMIEFDKVQDALLIRKTAQRGTYARNSLKKALSEVLPVKSEAQIAHLFELSQSSQVLFADKVILTEGKTELRLLPYLYKYLRSNTLGQDNIALIQTGSVDNIGKTMAILSKMDIPAKAVVDLDYVFKGALHNKHIEKDDKDYVVLSNVLQAMVEDGQIKLNGALPKAEHCAILAKDERSHEAIESLHQKLKLNNVWLWKNGAIESHLGLNQKNEIAWSKLKEKLDTPENKLEECCPDPQGIRQLTDWFFN